MLWRDIIYDTMTLFRRGIYFYRSFFICLFWLYSYFPQLTYADVAFFEFFNGFMAMGEPVVPKQLSKFPRLVDHYNRVLNVPEIKAWVEKRPKSQI